MPLINFAAREINYKIIYYGCGLCGKTTNIQYIHRKINPDVRVILSSGFGKEEVTGRFEGLGLAGFLQKPYRPDALLAEIRRCLG